MLSHSDSALSHSAPSHSARASRGRSFQAYLFLAGVATLASFAGCESSDPQSCEDQGGVIVVDSKGNERCEEACNGCLENNVCVGNRCALQCDSHADCYSLAAGNDVQQTCQVVKADGKKGVNKGADTSVCVESPKVAQMGLPCPGATECDGLTACPDGTACDDKNCDVATCKPLVCRSRGPQDAEAYCTTVDCQTDADCAGGFACAPRESDGQCDSKGSGEPSTGACSGLDAYNTANGTTYQEGPNWLLRNSCVKRESCSSCESNLDCSLSGMACVGIGATSHCAKTCLVDADCQNDYMCAGAAAPTNGYCIPRTQSCTPPATNNFCHPCQNDLDCGPPGSPVACTETSGNVRSCFDISFPDTCTSDSDCPQSPSGLFGECLDEPDGLGPGDSLYHRCYLPFRSSKFQCYPD